MGATVPTEQMGCMGMSLPAAHRRGWVSDPDYCTRGGSDPPYERKGWPRNDSACCTKI